ncbi:MULTISPECIES: PLP-dependent aminotransferase family protein [unclassified Pseudofrankia]|uniref:aminotransferase-like domain-containing protein n=1 Tax=unclassified Pseudofrankia TaxID=2994372 RepID=UPI0008D9CE4E|nr:MULTISPECIES: PLP-dependent aminotransferase family protein [unclassified Pseudofrankia]MDT3443216.1 PLP-dependent aminotransferase family protein [Pseudofrankia sp. BMG5.37]OHV58974.1 GntR family transcriptional regulator [Pseudofrankia sp. BMG5.36]
MEPIAWVERLGRWSSGRGPLYVLLAARIRALIDDGELPPGSRLPPDRSLAAALAVGRGTVVTAYDLLAVEGRITRRQGSGTRVAGDTCAPPRATAQTPAFLHLLEPRDGVLLLACAAPDAPPAELVDAYARAVPRLADITGDIGYHPMGHPALRRAIAERYQRRGVPTAPDRVLVTSGGQQALSLLARALLRPGDRVLVETPTYPGALEAFREQGALPRGLPVGLDGLAAAAAEHRSALAYVIASFHNPTGAVLPTLRRQRLARTAAAAGVALIDDEALADLGFPGAQQPPPPLAAHDDQVITIGSLSKAVWGGLRIGWVRAPVPLITRLGRLRAVHDLGGNIPAQLAAADLLGHLDAIQRREAARRQARHDHLRAELARHLPDWDAPAVPGGQTLWVRLPRGDGTSFAQTALRHGIAILPGTGLDAGVGSHEYLRLHFLATPEDLSEAVRRLTAAWRVYHPQPHRTPSTPTLAI